MGITLRSTTFNEPDSVSDVLKYEAGGYSREVVTILSGSGALGIGVVLGQILVGAATAAAKAGGNTGNGTLTMDATTPVRPGAKVGVYTVRCIAAAANNGTFRITDPDGFVVGDVVMAAGAGAFDNDLKFALADGASDFIVGDGFDITVAAGSKKWKPHTSGAVDGSEVARAVLLHRVDATSADQQAVVVMRHAEVSALGLKWHASVNNSDKKLAAHAQLAGFGIIVRQGA